MQPVLNRYLDKVIKDNRTIDARGVMQVNRMIELTMDEVFINLSVRMASTSQSDFERAAAGKLVRGISPEAYDHMLVKYAQNNAGMSSLLNDRLTPSVETGVSTEALWSRQPEVMRLTK